MTSEVRAAADEAFREEWGQVVATLIRVTGDWDLAEECAQEAFALALERWRRDGVPRRAGAWLTTVARNRAIDRLRREAVGAAKLREAAVLTPPEGPEDSEAAVSGVRDDRLRLMFTCCHPALSLEAQVAPSLAHDSAVMGDGRGAALPAERLAAVSVPTLVLDGGASPAWLREVARRAAGALPAGEHRTLEGQTHAVAPEVLAPVLEEFFGKG